LLKPVRKARLQRALEKAEIWSQAQKDVVLEMKKEKARSHLCAHFRGGMNLVPVSDVLFFRADNKYVTAKHLNGEVLLEESLKKLEVEFGERFFRIHRNALVAVNAVAGLEKEANGHMLLRLNGTPDLLEISRRHLPTVRKWLKSGKVES